MQTSTPPLLYYRHRHAQGVYFLGDGRFSLSGDAFASTRQRFCCAQVLLVEGDQVCKGMTNRLGLVIQVIVRPTLYNYEFLFLRPRPADDFTAIPESAEGSDFVGYNDHQRLVSSTSARWNASQLIAGMLWEKSERLRPWGFWPRGLSNSEGPTIFFRVPHVGA